MRKVSLLVLPFLFALAGCLSVGVGPLNFTPSSTQDLPLLYADPGVRIQRDGVGDVRYESGMVLLLGDRITTSGGRAVIDFDSDNLVALKSNTSIQLGSIRLFFGEVFVRIQELTGRGGGRVDTDELSASVEGTEYAVRRTTSGGGGMTEVVVRTGKVLCAPVGAESWKAHSLLPNRGLTMDGRQANPSVRGVDARAMTSWGDQTIDRLWRPRASAPNVNLQIPIPIGGTAGGGPRENSYDGQGNSPYY